MPRCSSRPSLIDRGKRLSTRAVALALVGCVVVGSSGAAGHATSQPGPTAGHDSHVAHLVRYGDGNGNPQRVSCGIAAES